MSAPAWRGGLVVAFFTAGMLAPFRHDWLCDGSFSVGDDQDGSVVIATLEHWFRVAAGRSTDWLSPGWFWPSQNTIAFTDPYALMALPNIVARAFGATPFLAYDLTIASRRRGGAALSVDACGRSGRPHL